MIRTVRTTEAFPQHAQHRLVRPREPLPTHMHVEEPEPPRQRLVAGPEYGAHLHGKRPGPRPQQVGERGAVPRDDEARAGEEAHLRLKRHALEAQHAQRQPAAGGAPPRGGIVEEGWRQPAARRARLAAFGRLASPDQQRVARRRRRARGLRRVRRPAGV